MAADYRRARRRHRVDTVVDDEWRTVKQLVKRQELGGLVLGESAIRAGLDELVRRGVVIVTGGSPKRYRETPRS